MGPKTDIYQFGLRPPTLNFQFEEQSLFSITRFKITMTRSLKSETRDRYTLSWQSSDSVRAVVTERIFRAIDDQIFTVILPVTGAVSILLTESRPIGTFIAGTGITSNYYYLILSMESIGLLNHVELIVSQDRHDGRSYKLDDLARHQWRY